MNPHFNDTNTIDFSLIFNFSYFILTKIPLIDKRKQN